MTAKRFDCDGEQLTVAEIRQRVPALSDSTVRAHLAAGRNTTAAILAFDPKRAQRAGGRVAANRAKAGGTARVCMHRRT